MHRATSLSKTSFWLFTLALISLANSITIAQEDQPVPIEYDYNRYALLIGVEDYQNLPKLRYTSNDALELRTVLAERGGYPYINIGMIGGQWADPTHNVIRATAQRLLRSCKPESDMLIYFSGHGYRAPDGTMYLCPSDIDPDRPEETGIPVAWLREELAACPAKFKLLILDACHAGSEKGEEGEGPTAKDLGEPFRDVAGVVTLASSTADEKSLLWEEKKQSLFSYWLTQGLKGHADENGDSIVDIDELNKYVHANVTHIAKTRFQRNQTPIRIIRAGAPGGAPAVMQVRPLRLDEILTDVADQLAWAIDDRKLDKVAVMEFSVDTPSGELLRVDFGLLGKLCASRLEQRLTKMSYNRYSVIDSRRLIKTLEDLDFKLDDLNSDTRLTDLSQQTGNIPIMALGVLRNRTGRAVTMQCRLVDPKTGQMAASTGGVAMLSESEWAMLGKSVHRKQRYAPLPNSPDDIVPDAVEELDDLANGPHPLRDPKFPFPVRIVVGNKERKGVFHGNDYYVPVNQGEVYSVQVESKLKDPVVMRLLVDGLNTLPEKVDDVKGVETYEVAPRVSLENARHWVLDPKRNRRARWTVKGFVTETGSSGKLREFKIVEKQDSVAAQQNFTDQIGIITAAFYTPLAEPRGGDLAAAAPGTGFGEERMERLDEVANIKPGRLRSVVHIHYVDAEELENLKQQWAAEDNG
jgi:hypothetical protein